MSLNNQKGETLIETVVSLAVLTTLLASVVTILLFSSRATRNSLNVISSTNSELYSLYDGTFDFSETEGFSAPVGLTFSVTDQGGNLIVSSTRYDIADGVRAYVADSGLIILR